MLIDFKDEDISVFEKLHTENSDNSIYKIFHILIFRCTLLLIFQMTLCQISFC